MEEKHETTKRAKNTIGGVASQDIRNYIEEAREALDVLRRAFDRASSEGDEFLMDEYRDGSLGAWRILEALDGIERCLKADRPIVAGGAS